jgi:hypothetical protein
MMYNINLNYVNWLENTDVKVLPIFEFPDIKVVLRLVQFFENLCVVCWRGYYITLYYRTILYDVIH